MRVIKRAAVELSYPTQLWVYYRPYLLITNHIPASPFHLALSSFSYMWAQRWGHWHKPSVWNLGEFSHLNLIRRLPQPPPCLPHERRIAFPDAGAVFSGSRWWMCVGEQRVNYGSLVFFLECENSLSNHQFWCFDLHTDTMHSSRLIIPLSLM